MPAAKSTEAFAVPVPAPCRADPTATVSVFVEIEKAATFCKSRLCNTRVFNFFFAPKNVVAAVNFSPISIMCRFELIHTVLFDLWHLQLDVENRAWKNAKKPCNCKAFSRASFLYTCYGPSDWIRTSGLLNPIQARYQTSPHPDFILLNYINTAPSVLQALFSFFFIFFYVFQRQMVSRMRRANSSRHCAASGACCAVGRSLAVRSRQKRGGSMAVLFRHIAPRSWRATRSPPE